MSPTVLIVEDDYLVAYDVAAALIEAGYEVAAMTSSEVEALDVASRVKPDYAVVDIHLGPGDGRVVAQHLRRCYGTAVLFATAQCRDVESLTASGAMACLPKPYDARDVPKALRAMRARAVGSPGARQPDHMITLSAA
jgi:two-component system, response regulator PdtaR